MFRRGHFGDRSTAPFSRSGVFCSRNRCMLSACPQRVTGAVALSTTQVSRIACVDMWADRCHGNLVWLLQSVKGRRVGRVVKASTVEAPPTALSQVANTTSSFEGLL